MGIIPIEYKKMAFDPTIWLTLPHHRPYPGGHLVTIR